MQKPSILIVEDEAIISLGIQDELELLGYQVAGVAYQGEEALKMADALHPDLVLMDINLRGKIDGIDTAVQIRNHAQIPIVFLTGAVDPAIIERTKVVEPYGYILKPFRIDDLHITIEHALNKHQLELSARQSEARFRELFETSLDGILTTDSEGNILDSNPAFQKILGYSPDELRKINITRLTPPEYVQEETRIIEDQVLVRGYSDDFIKSYWHQNGSRIPASVRIWLRKDSRGQPLGFWAIIRDLTDLQKSQHSLQESEHRLRNLVEKSPDGVSIVDPTGRVIEWNQSLTQISGIATSEATGQFIWDLQYRLVRSEQKSLDRYNALREMIQTGLSKGETTWFDRKTIQEIGLANGESKTIEWISYPIRERNGILIIGMVRDITAEKLAERIILRQSELSKKLSKLTELLNAQLELAKVLEIVCSEITQSMSIEAAQITLYDPEKDALAIVHYIGPINAQELIEAPYPMSLFQHFNTEQTAVLVIPDVQEVLIQHPYFHFLVEHNIRTAVIVSMYRESQLIGTLDLATIGKTRRFDQEELTFLATFANHAAIAIDRARMYQQTKRRTEELEVLGRLSATLRMANSRQEMLPVLLKEAITLAKAHDGVIYLLGQTGNLIASDPNLMINRPTKTWSSPEGAQWDKAFSFDDDFIIDSLSEAQANGGIESNPPISAIWIRILVPFRSTNTPDAIMILGYKDLSHFGDDERNGLLSLVEMGRNALHRSGLMEMLEQRVTDRTRELTALYDLTVFVNSPLGLDEVLNEALRKIIATGQAASGIIYRYSPDTSSVKLETQVNMPGHLGSEINTIKLSSEFMQWMETSRSPWLATRGNAQSHPFYLLDVCDYETIINVSIRFEGVTLGLLTVIWLTEYDPTAESIAFLSSVADRLGSAIQNDQLRQKSERTAVLEERQRLARELHDSVTQSLYSLTLLAEAGKDLLVQADLLRLQKCLSDLGENSVQALKEMRMLLFELRPPQQGEQGLIFALQNRLDAVERRAGVKAVLESEGKIFLSAKAQEELYRVAIEALNNSLKHSGASSVLVKLQFMEKEFQMLIEDNGTGFKPEIDRSGGLGLNTMRERVEKLGGVLEIRTVPGQGTRVMIKIISS